MVSLSEIRAANGSVTSPPKVAFFAGATSGIGKETLAALVRLNTPLVAYVAGRPETAEKLRPFLDELRKKHPTANIVWLDAELSLLSEAKKVAEIVKGKEDRLDVMCLSQGYAPFGGRKETKEGFEQSQVLGYYSRILLIQHLLPLLRRSEHARVLTVLGGHMLAPLNTADLQLEKPGAFGGMQSQKNMVTMTTLALEHLATTPSTNGNNIVFIHSYPGFVDTGNIKRGWGVDSWKSFTLDMALKPVKWAAGIAPGESGERHLFLLTSGRFGGGGDGQDTKAKNSMGGEGPGLFLVDETCETQYKEKLLKELRAGAQKTVWEKTMGSLKPYM